MADIVIGAKQFPAPKRPVKVSADTDRPKTSGTRLSGGAKMDISNPYGRGMDVSNPPMNSMEPHPEPKPHPVDEYFGRGIKRSNGRSIPREDVQISDN
jgi:hypothetical protein